MAREYYDEKLTSMSQDWGGDSSTGNKKVTGRRIQEFIKKNLTDLADADVAAAKVNPSVFNGFVDNVAVSTTDVGSDYTSVVYDRTRNMFLAVKDGNYYFNYDAFSTYNSGTVRSCAPYVGKIYVCGSLLCVWDGSTFHETNAVASEEAVRALVSEWGVVEEES